MGSWLDAWIDTFRSLGDALLTVLKAELATLQEDLKGSGRHLMAALGLLGAALVIFFWLIALLIALLVAVLCIWLQVWAATLVVLLLFVGCAGLLVWLGIRRLRQIENPVETVRRHVDDHLDWLHNRLLREGRQLEPAPREIEDEEEDLP
jgi:Flp pilus assembly protein TadB